jgi:hypothetical protein
MELIIFVAALCVVGVLAMRFGYDSRPSAHSKEEDLAGFGVSRDHPGTTRYETQPPAAVMRLDQSNKTSPARQAIRRSVGRVLHALLG